MMRDNCLFRPLYQAFSLYLMYVEKAEKTQVQGYGYNASNFLDLLCRGFIQIVQNIGNLEGHGNKLICYVLGVCNCYTGLVMYTDFK